MNTFRRSLLLGLGALALAGCASKPEIARIQDPDVDFHAYRTFAFIPGLTDRYTSLFERRLLAAARGQLERRGYVFDEMNPDMLVNIAAVVDERPGLSVPAAGQPGRSGAETEHHRLGRLAIDLIDADRRQVVWHGTAEGRVSPAMMRDAGTAVEKAVAAVLAGSPIQASTRAAVSAPKSP